MNLFVIRYAEIALKGSNREWFEKKLLQNLRRHLDPLGKHHSWKIHSRMLVETELDAVLVTKVLSQIPGIANFSLAVQETHDLERLGQAVQTLAAGYLDKYPQTQTFRIQASRADKFFPLNSMNLSAQLGGAILERWPHLKVQLKDPQMELGIEIWTQGRAILYLEKSPGLGGLPVGSSGRMMSLLSGGIDSPVASWQMNKRGAEMVYLNFHSYPYIGEESKEKVIQLVKHLSRYQPKTVLLVVPFAEIQKEIKAQCAERYRTLLYRRAMNRIGNRLSFKYRTKAFVTGEALGQVASQTIENLTCTEEAAQFPILRPLIGLEKSEIIQLAKTIGTYPISIQPYPDCCTVFLPRKPETRAKLEDLLEEEAKLDLETLVTQAVAGVEVLKFETSLEDRFF